MKNRKLFFFLTAFGISLGSFAQQTFHLSLDSAVAISIRESKKLKSDSQDIEIKEARMLQTKARQLPSASVMAAYTRLSDNVDPFILQLPGTSVSKLEIPQVVDRYTTALSVSQLLYAGGQVKYDRRSAKLEAEATKLDVEKSKTDVIYSTIKAYFELYKLQQTKSFIQQNRVQVQEHLENSKTYQKNGLILKNDVLRIELQLSELDHSLIEINSALEVAGFNLSILLGHPTATYKYELNKEDFTRTISIKDAQEYQEEAIINRTDYKAIQKRIGTSVLEWQSAKANYYPKLFAGTNYYYSNPNSRVFPVQSNFKGTWDVGLALSWDLHSLYRNPHKVRESKAVVAKTQFQSDQLLDDIKTEVNEDYQALIKNQEKIKVSKSGVKQAEENYRIVQKRFQNNTILTSELTDASSLLLQSQINLLVDQANTYEAYYKLLHASGSLIIPVTFH
jgi:outer membrane protein TolC